jgi:hypothetical protein
MKFIKIAGAGVVVAVVIGVALASASDAAASADSLFARQVAVLTQEGISPARAREAIRVQGKIAQTELVSKVEVAMGDAYGGVWFDAAAAQLHVGVTSHEGQRAAEGVIAREGLSGSVILTSVRSPWARLQATQKQWNSRLASLFAGGLVKTALDARHNAVYVSLSPSVPAPERGVIEREASTADVNVVVTVVPSTEIGGVPVGEKTECAEFVTFKAYCDKTITSGVTIQGKCSEFAEVLVGLAFFITQKECEERQKAGKEGKWGRATCTAGPLAIPEANGNETYLLTAGHCGEAKESWFSLYKNGKTVNEIGKAKTMVWNLGGDYGAIPVENAAWKEVGNDPVFAVTAEWKANAGRSFPVKGERIPAEGTTDCHDGQTSGGTCGKILKTNVTVNYGVLVEGLVEVEGKELVIKGGDSGGPFFFVEENKEVLMEGITVAVSGKENLGWFQPVHPVLAKLNLELLTKNNEVRREDLPEFSVETGFTGTSGKSKLGLAGAEVSCTSGTSEGTATSKKLGKFTIDFKGCKAVGTECHSLGDAKEVILMSGRYHLVKLKPEDVGVWFLILELHVECAVLGTLALIKGNVLGLITPILSKTTKFEIKLNVKEGKQEFTEFERDGGEKVKAALEGSVNGGAFKAATEELAENKITTTKETEIIKVK